MLGFIKSVDFHSTSKQDTQDMRQPLTDINDITFDLKSSPLNVFSKDIDLTIKEAMLIMKAIKK